jgi:RNA 3'-terminal phosphate cyclase (ATP)
MIMATPPTATTATEPASRRQETEESNKKQDDYSTTILIDQESSSSSSSRKQIIRIDGAMGEGGGQLLRNAISFATLLNQPMIVNNIRAGRSKPGLQAQHLASLQLPVEIMCWGYQLGEGEAKNSSKRQNRPNDHGNHDHDHDNDDDGAHKRQKDSMDNGESKNEQSTTTTTTLFLTGDVLHSQEIHFQPPSPPPPRPPLLLENTSSNNNNNHNQEQQQEWTITKDIGTAGSICLLLQAALPCAIFACLKKANKKALHLHLHGGTNATLAPQFDYWQRVFLPTVQEQCFGFNNNNNNTTTTSSSNSLQLPSISARMIRRGYYPRGGGHVCITIQPPASSSSCSSSNNDAAIFTTPRLHPIQLTERGNVQHIYIRSFHAGRLPRHLAENVAFGAEKLLRQTFPSLSSSSSSSHHGRDRGHTQQQPQKQQQRQQGPSVDIVLDIVTETHAVGSGLGILIVATTTTGCRLAGSALSDPTRKTKAADVGRAAAQELVDALKDGGCVDEWLQDQLILYMALADGISEIKTGSLTLHTQTAIQVAQVFCGTACFEIHKLSDNDDDGTTARKHRDCDDNDNNNGYGVNGRIAGQHLIRCHGIGHTV